MQEFSFQNLNPFSGIGEAELCRIAPGSKGRRVTRGTVLYDPAHPAPGIYVVNDGEVELAHDLDGTTVVFDVLGPGAMFGDFGGGPPTHTARTTRKSTLCVTPVDAFLSVVAAHPELVLHLMRVMAERIRDYEERLREGHIPARDRVYAELSRLQKQQRATITHAELARRTGLNRVTVTRTIGALKREGVVRELPSGGYEVM